MPPERNIACCCPGSKSATNKGDLVCLLPKNVGPGSKSLPGLKPPQDITESSRNSMNKDPKLLDENYLRKHFKLPKRALYLDAFRRPLITFPMTQENSNNFNLYRKTKTNQQILDGFLDASEAISTPSVFPYSDPTNREDEQELVYILQLPDLETECPVHKQPVKIPRFIYHSCKKGEDSSEERPRRGKGVLHKPKPWLLSRITDFDLLSQW